MTISTKRAEELLRNQTAIARKVYEVLPNAPDSMTAQGGRDLALIADERYAQRKGAVKAVEVELGVGG